MAAIRLFFEQFKSLIEEFLQLAETVIPPKIVRSDSDKKKYVVTDRGNEVGNAKLIEFYRNLMSHNTAHLDHSSPFVKLYELSKVTHPSVMKIIASFVQILTQDELNMFTCKYRLAHMNYSESLWNTYSIALDTTNVPIKYDRCMDNIPEHNLKQCYMNYLFRTYNMLKHKNPTFANKYYYTLYNLASHDSNYIIHVCGHDVNFGSLGSYVDHNDYNIDAVLKSDKDVLCDDFVMRGLKIMKSLDLPVYDRSESLIYGHLMAIRVGATFTSIIQSYDKPQICA